MAGNEAVDHIVFRPSGNTRYAGAGFGPVAYSCDPEVASEFYQDLDAVLRGEGQRVGQSSVARLRWRNDVVVLRRFPVHERSGRGSTACHAFLGDEAALPPEVCLAIRDWDWRGDLPPVDQAVGRIQPVDRYLLRSALRGIGPIAKSVGDVRGLLISVAAALIRAEPEHRLSVLDNSWGRHPPILLRALVRLFGERLGEWTFSTRETADSQHFRLAFMPAWPDSAVDDPWLTRVDPACAEDMHDPAVDLAERLVAYFLRNLRAYQDRLKELPVLTNVPVADRIGYLENVLPVGGHVVGSGRAGGRGWRERLGQPGEPGDEPWLVPQAGHDEVLHQAGHDDLFHQADSNLADTDPEIDPVQSLESIGHAPATAGVDQTSLSPAAEWMRSASPLQLSGRIRHDWPQPGHVPWQRRVAKRVWRTLHPTPPLSPTKQEKAFKELRDQVEGKPQVSRRSPQRLLACLDDNMLFECLERQDTTYPLAYILFDALAHRAPYWTSREADEACLLVLDKKLYLGRWGSRKTADDGSRAPDARSVHMSECLFNWAVRPRAERSRIAEHLATVMPLLWTDARPEGYAVVTELVTNDKRSLPFSEATWRALFQATASIPSIPWPPTNPRAGRKRGPANTAGWRAWTGMNRTGWVMTVAVVFAATVLTGLWLIS
jgi:hypothetical protein